MAQRVKRRPPRYKKGDRVVYHKNSRGGTVIEIESWGLVDLDAPEKGECARYWIDWDTDKAGQPPRTSLHEDVLLPEPVVDQLGRIDA